MTPEDLKNIANSPGYGTGKRAMDVLHQRAERLRMLPEPDEMNELLAQTEPDALVASFGYDDETNKDWFLNANSDCLTSECLGTRFDAFQIAAVWNSYRAGDLVLKDDDI